MDSFNYSFKHEIVVACVCVCVYVKSQVVTHQQSKPYENRRLKINVGDGIGDRVSENERMRAFNGNNHIADCVLRVYLSYLLTLSPCVSVFVWPIIILWCTKPIGYFPFGTIKTNFPLETAARLVYRTLYILNKSIEYILIIVFSLSLSFFSISLFLVFVTERHTRTEHRHN